MAAEFDPAQLDGALAGVHNTKWASSLEFTRRLTCPTPGEIA